MVITTTNMTAKHDLIAISDIHLGSNIAECKRLLRFLNKLKTEVLVIDGDLFDNFNNKLKHSHLEVLEKLSQLSKEVQVVWVKGNHDEPAEQALAMSRMLGIELREVFVWQDFLFIHGDMWDEFIKNYKFLTTIADGAYRFLQWVDKTHTYARMAKRNSKTFLRCIEKVRDGAIAFAKELKCGNVVCGHTHHDEHKNVDGVNYYNIGSWAERPCHYLQISNNIAELKTYG